MNAALKAMANPVTRDRLGNAFISGFASYLAFVATFTAYLYYNQAEVNYWFGLMLMAFRVSLLGFLAGLCFKEKRNKWSVLVGCLVGALIGWYLIRDVTPRFI